MNITHLYIRSDHKLARPDLIEVRKEFSLKIILKYFLFRQTTKSGAKCLRTDAIHPLTEQFLPIFINDEADFGPKIRANMPMLNVQIGTKKFDSIKFNLFD